MRKTKWTLFAPTAIKHTEEKNKKGNVRLKPRSNLQGYVRMAVEFEALGRE